MREPCKPNTQEIELPELGVVFVRSIGMRERADLAKKIDESDNSFDPAMLMFELMVVEESGDQIWDVDSWSTWSGKYLDSFQELSAVVADFAGYGVDKAKKN